MMDKDVLNTIKEKGLLLEKEIYELIDGFGNAQVARNFLEQIEKVSGKKMITKNVLNKNVEYVRSFVGNLGDENKKVVEKVFVNLGMSLEVIREKEIIDKPTEVGKNNSIGYQVFYSKTIPDRKLEVKDFTGYFRTRYQHLQRILMSRAELQHNLVSIGKIGSDRNSLSIIGIVTEKRVTKNKNMIIKFEDLTGALSALVKFDRAEIFSKAEER